MADLTTAYEREREVDYQGERYIVRDNGAVLRKSRAGRRRRKLDDVWTFGTPSDSRGYMYLGSHVVHRIVALAFHEQPTKQHVVDHIDTNRRNNRVENLRWLTRLENVLLNPLTLKKVILLYGSLEAFFKNPSAMRTRDQSFDWMRTVSKEEAQECYRRFFRWANSNAAPRGGELGEWVFAASTPTVYSTNENSDLQSATPIALQRNWRTISAFPACPETVGEDPLSEYAARLSPGAVFSSNKFGETTTGLATKGAMMLGVLCRMPQPAIKDWALSKVVVENGKFVHESLGTFFSFDGGMNAFNKLLGIDAPHVENIDDYC